MALKLFRRKRSTSCGNPADKNCHSSANDVEQSVVINIKDVHTQITETIGESSHSVVYEGSWESHHGLERVAVKIPNKAENGMHLQLLLKEAAILANLKHPNIIKMHGIVLDPVKLILEFAIMGDLLSYLRIHENVFTAKRMHNYAEQIAVAMEFLRQQGIVHQNLAAKNVLIRMHNQVKLSGFKFAEYVNEKGVFQSNNAISPGRIPWSSLEVLQQGTFSTASDVWSYGITLWEIYSLGAVPWNGLSSTEITDAYLGKRYLEKPKRCHQHIYHMMLNCWSVYPEQRISFNDICHTLNEVPYEEVMSVVECNPAEDDGDNLHYKQGDKIVVIDKHTDAWWTGIHTVNGQCGWFQVNNTRSDVTPLDTLKDDIKQKKKHLVSITIGLPSNIVHHVHIGNDGEKWYDRPLPANALLKATDQISTSSVKRAVSLPSSMDTLKGCDASDETLENTTKKSATGTKEPQLTPEARKKQIPVTPQSSLTEKTAIYGNADTIIAHKLHLDLNSFTASCPDIPSHIYQNTTNGRSLEVPIAHPVPNGLGVAENNLKSSEVPPQMVQSEWDSSKHVTSSDTDISLPIYYNTTDLGRKKTDPEQLPIATHAKPVTTNISAAANEAPGEYAHLINVIKKQFPHITTIVITQFLIKNGGNTEQALKDIKVSQLTDMKLEGFTEADCRAILEQCNWDLSKAAEILCS